MFSNHSGWGPKFVLRVYWYHGYISFRIHYGFGPSPSHSLFTIWHSFLAKEKKLKLPYHVYLSSKWKNKTTLFSPTFKVKQNKVVLFFQFELKWMRYGHIMFWNLCFCTFKAWKRENGHILLILAQNEKITPLYFLQLLKLEKIKWCYFFILS